MTLAAEDVVRQLPGVVRALRDELRAMQASIGTALAGLGTWTARSDEIDARIERAMAGSPRPYALSLEQPVGAAFAPAAAPPVTVVAADGSSVPIDRYAALPCYALNIGTVSLSYGISRPPWLHARARVGPGGPDGDPDVSSGGLDLLRDVCELEAAAEAATRLGGETPVVVLLDGTLLPWDLDSPQIEPVVRHELRDRTSRALEALRALGPSVALGSYVSASRSADVVTSLQCLRDGTGTWPRSDGMLFRAVLTADARSAVFRARSQRSRRVEQQFAPDQEVCFFYMRTGDDVARVELPRWATGAARVGLLHAALADQCRRCDGYPRALQEAHELAVISGSDRQLFARLLDREGAVAGAWALAGGKMASKRRRGL